MITINNEGDPAVNTDIYLPGVLTEPCYDSIDKMESIIIIIIMTCDLPSHDIYRLNI